MSAKHQHDAQSKIRKGASGTNYKQKQKISVFIDSDHFVIEECKLCNKE